MMPHFHFAQESLFPISILKDKVPTNLFVILFCSKQKVQHFERLIVFRLGRLLGAKGPGWYKLVLYSNFPQVLFAIPGLTIQTA